MSVEMMVLAIGAIAGLAALLWWLLITTEGVYLGRGVVIWLYDVVARRYDRIKNFDPDWESVALAYPILAALEESPAPLILDVATGTARLPITLAEQEEFAGHIVGLDYSRHMLKVAAENCLPYRAQISLIYQPAEVLPFPDETFDMVACLEALEFMADAEVVLHELVRVAKPGALILTTVRRGTQAKLMPGKTRSREAFIAQLREIFGLAQVTGEIWTTDYDLIWANKPGHSEPVDGTRTIAEVLRCRQCGESQSVQVSRPQAGLRCLRCEALIPCGADGVIEYAG